MTNFIFGQNLGRPSFLDVCLEIFFVFLLGLLFSVDIYILCTYPNYSENNQLYYQEYINTYFPYYKYLIGMLTNFLVFILSFTIYQQEKWRRSNYKYTAAGVFYCQNTLFRAGLNLISTSVYIFLVIYFSQQPKYYIVGSFIDSLLISCISVLMVCNSKEFRRIFLKDKKVKPKKPVYVGKIT